MMFDLAKFRILYPLFRDLDDEVIEAFAEQAQCIVNAQCAGACGDAAWMAVTAHLLSLSSSAESGDVPSGSVLSATIDKVSVTYRQRVSRNAWSDWLGLTPFGEQALALMNACSSGGDYYGGLPELAAFRKVGGIY